MDPTDRFATAKLKAPSKHGQALVYPEPATAAKSIQERLAQRDQQGTIPSTGIPWNQLITDARRDLWEKARNYSGAYLDLDLPTAPPLSPLLLLGHQPELFHPGVWFKNFFAARLAEHLAIPCVNLLIDNATVDATSIKVPTGTPGKPRVETIAFDQTATPIPHESRDVLDLATFQSFTTRIDQAMGNQVPSPLVHQLWPQVLEAQQATRNLGQSLARGRHRIEALHGIHNLDVPLSSICESEPFYWFLSAILSQLPRFWEIHNQGLAEYRQAYRVRSHSHPVPVLVAEDEWLEAPFWIWSRSAPQRQPLFVRYRGDQLEMTDRQQLEISLSMPSENNLASFVEQLADHAAGGLCIRPRALVTTMYARLVLGDLFIHGIGGGRYDQLTNVIVERFFEIEPPDFLTVTATFQLPLELPECDATTLPTLDQQLRELRFSPERYLATDCKHATESDLARLILDKEKLLERVKSGQAPSSDWHQRMKQVNEQLALFASQKREDLEKQRVLLEETTRTRSQLESREFSFCLFPQETLCPLLLALSREGL